MQDTENRISRLLEVPKPILGASKEDIPDPVRELVNSLGITGFRLEDLTALAQLMPLITEVPHHPTQRGVVKQLVEIHQIEHKEMIVKIATDGYNQATKSPTLEGGGMDTRANLTTKLTLLLEDLKADWEDIANRCSALAEMKETLTRGIKLGRSSNDSGFKGVCLLLRDVIMFNVPFTGISELEPVEEGIRLLHTTPVLALEHERNLFRRVVKAGLRTMPEPLRG